MKARSLDSCMLALLLLSSVMGGADCDGPIPPPEDSGVLVEESSIRVIAMAGPDLEVLEGSRVRLSAQGSRSLDGSVTVVWSQIDGPTVLLTDPTSPAPVFVAPLAPATLRFRVRAQRGDASAFDDVVVRVRDTIGRRPPLIDIPGDAVGIPGEERTFPVTIVSGDESTLELAAELICEGSARSATPVVSGMVTLTLADELPCIVRAWGVTPDGRRSPRTARVFWPVGTSLAGETRARAPVLVPPGSPVAITVDDDRPGPSSPVTSLFVIDGDSSLGFLEPDDAGRLRVQAPLRHGPFHLAAERRGGVFSGGIRYVVVDVSPGEANRAPTVNAGPDRQALPNGTFGLQVTTTDFDGDALTIHITQVLGETAVRDDVATSVFRAPPVETTILFHVVVSDGKTESPPESVRVNVAANVVNLPPVLNLEPALWTTPGSTFVIDASDATDPDSGYIASVHITQDSSDPVIVLDGSVNATSVALTAGSSGDVYRFRVTAFDDAGASVSKDVVVTVENAGPYVDAARGDDASGNGTIEQPFASLGAAFPVVARHRMPAIRMAAGPQLPFVGITPFESTIIGGHVFIDDAYVEAMGRTTLPLGADGLMFTAGGLALVDIVVDVPAVSIVIDGAVGLTDVTVSAGAAHTGILMRLLNLASANMTNVTVTGGGAHDGIVIDVEVGAALRLTDSTIHGGSSGTRVGLSCTGATIDVVSSTIRGGDGELAIAIRADSCDMAFLGGSLVGGAGQRCVAFDAKDSTVFANSATTFVGCDDDAAEGVGVALSGVLAPIHIEGSIFAAHPSAVVDDALALDIAQPRVEVEHATIVANGATRAVAARIEADRCRMVHVVLDVTSTAGEATILSLGSAPDLVIANSTLAVTGHHGALVIVDEHPLLRPSLEETTLTATFVDEGRGVDLSGALAGLVRNSAIILSAGHLAVDSAALSLDRVDVDGLDVDVTAGGDPVAVHTLASPTITRLDRLLIRASSIDGGPIGLLVTGDTELRSSCIVVDGPGTSRGVMVRAPLVARHVTVVSPSVGMELRESGTGITLANSLIAASAGLNRLGEAALPILLDGNVFDADTAYLDGNITVSRGGQLQDIPNAGAANAFGIVIDDLDERGRMATPASDLIDVALSEHAVSFDVDGDARPLGLADVGCDEWVDD
jgi:hypothetical protein